MLPKNAMLAAGLGLAATGVMSGLAVPARAQPAADQAAPAAAPQNPAPGASGASAVPQGPAPGEPGFAAQVFDPARTNLLGGAYGLRAALDAQGVSFGLQNSAEVFGNVSGGISRGASGNGLLEVSVGLDTQKAFGWDGGTFNASGFAIYGPNFSRDYLGVLQTSSSIAAEATVRLWELWYQQAFAGGQIDLKLGLQSIDQEFMISQDSGLFLNAMMGWPIIPSTDLYAGGPAYPLSSLGVRLRGQPSDTVTVLGGVFQDNPPGGTFDNDDQLRGSSRWGGNFNLRTGALAIAEIQFAVNPPPPAESGGGSAAASAPHGLPGTYKLGAWYDTGRFPAQASATAGLANATRSGNYSVYAVADQTVWQAPDGARAVSLFVRPMAAPASRNLVDASIDAGATLKAPLPGRDNDTLGVGFGLANLSSRAGAYYRSLGSAITPRGAETFLEATYQFQVAPWWVIQPDFQYFWMPSGGIANPNIPNRRIGNEAVFGARTVVTF